MRINTANEYYHCIPYTISITDALFPIMRIRFPGYTAVGGARIVQSECAHRTRQKSPGHRGGNGRGREDETGRETG